MMSSQLDSGDTVIIVDVCNDVCPAGTLPVPDDDTVIPVYNEWVVAARQAGARPPAAA